MKTNQNLLLAGDLGGTKTNLMIFSSEIGPREPLKEATFPSAQYPSLEALVSDFLSQANLKIERASFGVAGPVVSGQAKITNLPWVMNETQLSKALNLFSVRLLNDLKAIACAVPHLQPEDVATLNAGEPVKGGPMAVIAPGTGLGEAFLIWNGSRYRAHASEGGHADFAPNNSLEAELYKFLEKHFGHVSYERVCAGIGIPNIYAFLQKSGYAEEPAWLAKQLATAKDPTPIIMNAAMDGKRLCKLCTKTLEIFVAVLGAEAGNLALKVLATGGIYLGGGIPPRIMPVLKQEQFMKSFQGKGRLSNLMAKMPVHVILNPKAALLGAAYAGLEN
ncbi:glucokinase [Candidatus Acetothermia bacterium]|nr:glucokinase [Candidatus Acetothermia bacterium]